MAENPIGTGPYKFVHWLKGREILMERNDNYWGPKPAFQYAKIRIIPDKATQVADLLAGGVDMVRALPPDQIEVLKASGAAYATTAPVLRTAFIQLDSQARTEKNPFTDKRVRQAVNYGVNIDKIIQFVLNGQAVRTANVINPMAFGHDPNVKPYPYDPEKAKKLLAEAGYPNGFEVRFLSTGADVPAQKQAAEAIQADLAKIGVKLKINHIEDTNSVVAQVKEGKAGPMFQWSWGYYSVFDADGILYDIFHSGNPWAYFWSDETDKLIDEGRSTLDQEKRKKLYSACRKSSPKKRRICTCGAFMASGASTNAWSGARPRMKSTASFLPSLLPRNEAFSRASGRTVSRGVPGHFAHHLLAVASQGRSGGLAAAPGCRQGGDAGVPAPHGL